MDGRIPQVLGRTLVRKIELFAPFAQLRIAKKYRPLGLLLPDGFVSTHDGILEKGVEETHCCNNG